MQFLYCFVNISDIAGQVLNVQELMRLGHVSFGGKYVFPREETHDEITGRLHDIIKELLELQIYINSVLCAATPEPDDRQEYIMKTICSQKLSKEQRNAFLDAAESGYPLSVLKHLADTPIPVENMKVLKAYLERRGDYSE